MVKGGDALGSIHALHICPGHRKPMVRLRDAEAVANRGLTGDRHALPDSSRQILLIEKETIDDLRLEPGQVKENVTTAGMRLMHMRSGERLLLGEEVILEITKACSPCSRMDEVRPGLLKELAGKRGMLARVVRGGTIREGDTVRGANDQP